MYNLMNGEIMKIVGKIKEYIVSLFDRYECVNIKITGDDSFDTDRVATVVVTNTIRQNLFGQEQSRELYVSKFSKWIDMDGYTATKKVIYAIDYRQNNDERNSKIEVNKARFNEVISKIK